MYMSNVMCCFWLRMKMAVQIKRSNIRFVLGGIFRSSTFFIQQNRPLAPRIILLTKNSLPLSPDQRRSQILRFYIFIN
jgi:hypothetical protein